MLAIGNCTLLSITSGHMAFDHVLFVVVMAFYAFILCCRLYVVGVLVDKGYLLINSILCCVYIYMYYVLAVVILEPPATWKLIGPSETKFES